MPNPTKKTISAAKAILSRISAKDMQVFDVQCQSVHDADEIKALKAVLKSYIDRFDQDWKVEAVVEPGNLSIEPGDAPANVLQEAANAMDAAETTEIVGGSILFKGTNGRWYTVVVESHIAPADPKFVKVTLNEIKQVHVAAIEAIEGLDATADSRLEALAKLRKGALPEFQCLFDEASERIRGKDNKGSPRN